jgi:hypothetical protein
LDAGWDTHCPGLAEAQKGEAEWKEKEQVWSSAPTNSTSGWDVTEDDPYHYRWVASDAKLFTTLYAMSRGVRPSVEKGIEVSIEVHSDLQEEHPTCRSLVPIGYLSVLDLLSFLCYSAVDTSNRSCTSFGSH